MFLESKETCGKMSKEQVGQGNFGKTKHYELSTEGMRNEQGSKNDSQKIKNIFKKKTPKWAKCEEQGLLAPERLVVNLF